MHEAAMRSRSTCGSGMSVMGPSIRRDETFGTEKASHRRRAERVRATLHEAMKLVLRDPPFFVVLIGIVFDLPVSRVPKHVQQPERWAERKARELRAWRDRISARPPRRTSSSTPPQSDRG